MRSKDIAGLAGVTVRAVRHYHQIGLLSEPSRDRNGYRRYDVTDLVRLLRIKGLVAAGVPLADMRSFLENGDTSPDDLLDALDKQLLEQIDRLQQQRQLVSRLRSKADMPSGGKGLARQFELLTAGGAGLSAEIWREQLTLFSHLLGEEDLRALSAIYEHMAERPETVLALSARFDALTPDSDAQEIEALASDYAHHFGSAFSKFRDIILGPGRSTILNLLHAHTIRSVNASQRKMLDAIFAHMG